MKRVCGMFLGVAAVFLLMVPSAQAAMKVIVARMLGGQVQVVGFHAAKKAPISWQGTEVATSTAGGTFFFHNGAVPASCVGELSDGVESKLVAVQGCEAESLVLATGQTTAYPADKNDGIVGPVDVPDDGTLKLGLPLQYHDNGDGTVTDLNTGLMWEVKTGDLGQPVDCSANDCTGDLHDVKNLYLWFGNGNQETIWDWLDDVNAEGGTGFAGHNDWRIPNLKELESIVDSGLANPAIQAVFGTTFPANYWTSTLVVNSPGVEWTVDFAYGDLFQYYGGTVKNFVRAVRGGL